MKNHFVNSRAWIAGLLAVTVLTANGLAQRSFESPVPERGPVPLDVRRTQYLDRVEEISQWRMGLFTPDKLDKMDMSAMSLMLMRGINIEACNDRVLEYMKEPGTGPFWMFPTTMVAYAGRDKLSAEARAAIREA